MSTRKSLLRRIALITLVLLLSGQACTISLIQFPDLFPANPTTQPGVVTPAGPSPTPQPMAQTTFVAILPEQLAAGETLFLTVLDEVTGLSLNATYYQMQPRDPHDLHSHLTPAFELRHQISLHAPRQYAEY